MALLTFCGGREGRSLVGWGGSIHLLRYRRCGGVCRSVNGGVRVGGDLGGGNVRRGWRLNWEAKVNAVALVDVDGAKAARAESDLGGAVGGHRACRAL